MEGLAFRDLEAIRAMPRYYEWKSGLVGKHAGRRILEVGCGTGLLLERLGGRELLAGIDRDSGCVQSARERLTGIKGVDIRLMDVLSPEFASLATLRPDTVVFSNVLEAVDEERALRNAISILPPGGRVVIFTSAMPSLEGGLDHSYGQKRYSKKGLQDAMTTAGFTVNLIRHVNMLGAFGWWLDSQVLRKREMSPGAYRMRDMLVPFARTLDALTGPPFGRSLLAVGTRG